MVHTEYRSRMPGAYIHEPDSESDHSDSPEEKMTTLNALDELELSATQMHSTSDSDVDATEDVAQVSTNHFATFKRTSAAAIVPEHPYEAPTSSTFLCATSQHTTGHPVESQEPREVSTSIFSDQYHLVHMVDQLDLAATSLNHSVFDSEDFRHLGPSIINTTPPPSIGSSQFGGLTSEQQSRSLFDTAAGPGLFGPRYIGEHPGQTFNHANDTTSRTTESRKLFEPTAKAPEDPYDFGLGEIEMDERGLLYKLRVPSESVMVTHGQENTTTKKQTYEPGNQTPIKPSIGVQTTDLFPQANTTAEGMTYPVIPSKAHAEPTVQVSDTPTLTDTLASRGTRLLRAIRFPITAVKIMSPKEFLAAVQEKIIFPKEAYNGISEHVEAMYPMIHSFKNQMVANMLTAVTYRMSIAECEEDLATLRAMPETQSAIQMQERGDEIERLRGLKEQLKHSITTNDMRQTYLQDTHVDSMVKSIAAIVTNAHMVPVIPEEDELKELYTLRAEQQKWRADRRKWRSYQQDWDVLEAKVEDMKKLHEESRAGAGARIMALEAEIEASRKENASEIKELQSTHRNTMNTRLSEWAREQEAELRRVKESYASRIGDAETRLREQKKAVASIRDLKLSIQQLEREKNEGVLSKAALEKELNDAKEQLNEWEGYKDGYEQIKIDYDKLQGDYCDVVVERDDLLASASAPVNQALGSNQPPTVTSKLHAGTFHVAGNNVESREIFWQQQEDLADIARRKKLAEIEEIDWVLEGLKKQILELEKTKGLSNSNPDNSGDEDEPDDGENNKTDDQRKLARDTETRTSQSSTQQDDSQDMSGQPFTSEMQESFPAQATHQSRQPKGARPVQTTWAKKTAEGKPDRRHGYVQATDQGSGVTTVKKNNRDSRRGASRDN